MTLTSAIHPDGRRHRNSEEQSSPARWAKLAERAGYTGRLVGARAAESVARIAGCDAFMWRPPLSVRNREFSQRLLPAIETGLGIPVFPSWRTLWHSENKIAQCYLLEAIGAPVARTWVFWRLEDALAFIRTAGYPLVMKLSTGFQSNGVQLLRTVDEAAYWARRMFTTGAAGFDEASPLRRRLAEAKRGIKLMAGRPLPPNLEYGYLYLQEFLPDNPHDTRVTVIGDRAFAFRRFNRPDDFRASGSGRIDWDPAAIDLRHVRLALRVARALGVQTVGLDLLYRDGEPVVCETTYAYASWAVRDCPGHWRLCGSPEHGELAWVEGKLRPEDAIFEDFADTVQARSG